MFIHRLGEGSRLVVDAHRRGPSGRLVAALAAVLAVLGGFVPGLAHADESRIILPDFSSVNFLFGLIDGHTLLLFGMIREPPIGESAVGRQAVQKGATLSTRIASPVIDAK